MRRIGSVTIGAVLMLAVTAAPASARYAPPPPLPGGGHGGTAFTGSDLSLGIVLLIVMAVAGLVALTIGRRRSSSRVTP
jgi:hypothetical protein